MKKLNIHRNDNKDYWLVSNVSFNSKIIEKAVAADFNRYIHDNELGEPLRSPHLRLHSTAIALLHAKYDIPYIIDD